MRLQQDFYNRNTSVVAKQLLGKYLVHSGDQKTEAAMITETEAYHGLGDRASHASRGRTPRTEVMFGPPGCTYVYLIYGMYHCLNFTTMRKGFPAAVLIRAVFSEQLPMNRTNGPGKLCRALNITKKQNSMPVENEELWVEDRGIRVPRSCVKMAPRMGVDYAGPEWSAKKWRFIYTYQTN